jgi:hypothetical protein
LVYKFKNSKRKTGKVKKTKTILLNPGKIHIATTTFILFQLFIKSITLMIEEVRELFDSAPSKLSEDVAAHFRRLEDDSAKFLDPPPQFSSVHRVQTRRQAILQRNHVNVVLLKKAFISFNLGLLETCNTKQFQ